MTEFAAPATTVAERAEARRRRLVANYAPSFAAADDRDLQYWQSLTPEERLTAWVALRRDVELVEESRTGGSPGREERRIPPLRTAKTGWRLSPATG